VLLENGSVFGCKNANHPGEFRFGVRLFFPSTSMHGLSTGEYVMCFARARIEDMPVLLQLRRRPAQQRSWVGGWGWGQGWVGGGQVGPFSIRSRPRTIRYRTIPSNHHSHSLVTQKAIAREQRELAIHVHALNSKCKCKNAWISRSHIHPQTHDRVKRCGSTPKTSHNSARVSHLPHREHTICVAVLCQQNFNKPAPPARHETPPLRRPAPAPQSSLRLGGRRSRRAAREGRVVARGAVGGGRGGRGGAARGAAGQVALHLLRERVDGVLHAWDRERRGFVQTNRGEQ